MKISALNLLTSVNRDVDIPIAIGGQTMRVKLGQIVDIVNAAVVPFETVCSHPNPSYAIGSTIDDTKTIFDTISNKFYAATYSTAQANGETLQFWAYYNEWAERSMYYDETGAVRSDCLYLAADGSLYKFDGNTLISAGFTSELDTRLKAIEDSLGDIIHTTKSWVELQSDGAIASIPIYGDVSVTSDNTVQIELVPSTDSLYVKFNRPLEADEYLMLLRRGTNVRRTNWMDGESRAKKDSKLRWHIYPAVLTIGTGEYEGEIGLDDVELITGVAKPINQSPTRWIAKTLAQSGTYAGVIYKCHNSREIVVPGWTKSVKFGLAVYKGELAATSWPLKQPLKRISDVAFFYSTGLFDHNGHFVQHYSLVDETKKQNL